MRDFQGIVFMGTRTYKESFKSVLVYLREQEMDGNFNLLKNYFSRELFLYFFIRTRLIK